VYLLIGVDGAVVRQQEGGCLGFPFSTAIKIQHTYPVHFCVPRSPRCSKPLVFTFPVCHNLISQVEGLVADYDLTLGNLIGIIRTFFEKIGE
jgi:hypothetical protein